MSFAFWFKSNATGNWGKIFDFGNGTYDNIIFGINNNFIACGVHNDVILDYINFYSNYSFYFYYLVFANGI